MPTSYPAGPVAAIPWAVLIAAQYLVDRLRHPRSRADEVAALRRRFAIGEPASEEERALALELLALRREMTAALAGVASCGGCAEGHPLPHGRYHGGHCCGTRTENVFTDAEVAALRLSGTTGASLQPARGDHAGCAFRGPEGCALTVADRPNICVRFVCLELEGELRERGDLREIKAFSTRIGKTLERFTALRDQRRSEEDDEP